VNAGDLSLIGGIGAPSVLALVILAVIRGYIVPRRTVDSIIKGKDESIEFWKHAAMQREQALQETIPVLKQIHEDHEVVVKLVASLNEAVTRLAITDQGLGR